MYLILDRNTINLVGLEVFGNSSGAFRGVKMELQATRGHETWVGHSTFSKGVGLIFGCFDVTLRVYSS